jgi:EXLDI family protein
VPNKTIYVSNEDQAVYDKAQTLAGDNLSSVIARALREFISRIDSQKKGLKEVAVQVGTKGLQQEKRFNGRLVVKWQGAGDDGDKAWFTTLVYRTAKNHWAVALTRQPDYDIFRQRDFWRKADYFDYTPDTRLLVFETLEEAAGKLPGALVKLMKMAQNRDEAPVEYLDI